MQLGNGTTDGSYRPVQVTALGANGADVSVSWTHSCARSKDGRLWCWGRNDAGQLGDGTLQSARYPVRALGLGCNCGDGVCSRAETSAGFAADCSQASCGDGRCATAEDERTCPGDCRPQSTAETAIGGFS